MLKLYESELFYDFHVALRKRCHSPISGVLWNLFCIDAIDRASYFAGLWARIEKEKPGTAEDLATLMMEFSAGFGEAGRHDQIVIRAAFNLVDRSEWLSIAEFLVECSRGL